MFLTYRLLGQKQLISEINQQKTTNIDLESSPNLILFKSATLQLSSNTYNVMN